MSYTVQFWDAINEHFHDQYKYVVDGCDFSNCSFWSHS